jgi:hypothetical protein
LAEATPLAPLCSSNEQLEHLPARAGMAVVMQQRMMATSLMMTMKTLGMQMVPKLGERGMRAA